MCISRSLHALALDGNPVAARPAYKHVCLSLLPNLRVLEDKPITITPQERPDIRTHQSLSIPVSEARSHSFYSRSRVVLVLFIT